MPEKERVPIYGVLIIVLVIALSTSGYFFTTGRSFEINQMIKEFQPNFGKMPEVYDLGKFVVNLNSPEHFMRVHLVAEINIPEVKKERRKYEELKQDLKIRDSKIKDILTTVMSNYDASELVTTEGKEELREELLKEVNEEIGRWKDGRKKISNIYFWEIVIE